MFDASPEQLIGGCCLTVLLAGGFLVGSVFLVWFAWQRLGDRCQKRRESIRGFEVKLTTGRTPVPEERDKTNG